MTIIAVVYAYLSDSMPEIYLSETDQEFIADFQNFFAQLSNKWPLRWFFWFPRWKDIDQRRKLSRKQREKAVTQFIVSLSDQQLATGLSILIAAIANQCTLSPTEFRIAFALAWFSSTTHLATLDCLWHYFIFHKTIRNWRVFGMVVVMALFLYCFAIVLIIDNNMDEEPVQCYIEGLVKSGLRTDFLDLAMSYGPWAITNFILLFGYKTRVFRTYEYGSSDVIGFGPLSKWVLTIWSKRKNCTVHHLPDMSAQEWTYVRNEAALEVSATTRRKLLEEIVKSKSKTRVRQFLHIWRLAEHRYQHSILTLVPPMTFMLSYGLSQMVWFRWQLSGPSDIDLNPMMGFGQITALILLALPVLSAAEIYYESIHHAPDAGSQDDDLKRAVRRTSEPPKVQFQDSSILPKVFCSEVKDPESLHPASTEQAYERRLLMVRKYFYSECKAVSELQLQTDDGDRMNVVLNLKRQLLDATEEFITEESHLKSVPKLIKAFMFLSASLSATAATIFNTPSLIGTLLGAIYLYLQLAIQVGCWILSMRRINVEHYVQLLSEARARAK